MFNKRLLASVLAACSAICTGAETQSDAGMTAAPDSVLTRTLFLDAAVRGNVMAVVGDRGKILVSSTGQAWRQATTPIEITLTSVYFHNEMLGWAAGHDAVILKTVDGGRQWRQVYSDPDSNSPVLDIWFADDKYGIAIGAYGLFLVTTDGGENWIRDDLNIIHRDPAHAEQGDAVEPYDLHLNAMARSASGSLYIAAEAGHLFRSADLGRTWQELPSPYHGSFFGVLPLDGESLLVFGLRGHLYRSDDNGLSWAVLETQTSETMTNALRLRNGNIIVTGMGGVVLTSEDQGRTFTARELRYKYGYAAIIESGNGNLIIAGDHGIENWNRKDIGLAHE